MRYLENGSLNVCFGTGPVTGQLDEDRAANNHALRHNEGRLLSAYQVPAWLTAGAADPTVWVITDDLEDDEHTTTMLWPTDY